MKKRLALLCAGVHLAAFSGYAQDPPPAAPTPAPLSAAGHGDVAEANKAVVVGFYELAFNRHRPTEAARKYIGDEYICCRT